MADHSNVSTDLLWGLCRSNNAYLVKRRTGGGSQFSRDPLNLMNIHSRKAVGVQLGDKGTIALTTKKVAHQNRPAVNKNEVVWSGNKSGPKIYRGIASYTGKQNYRADLRQAAVARAGALRQTQRPKKDVPEKKPRGAKARMAAEKDS
ncbi:MAG: hypothetical protein Q9190_001212 [Brigantiaea leucoxantha]